MILNSPTISGSLTVTGNIITSGSITISGSIASASYASNADLLDGLDATVFTLTSSFNAQTASFTAFTASLNAFSASQNSFTASILAQTASLNSFSASILSYTASQNILNGTYTLTSSFNAQTASFTAFSASVLTFTGSASTRLGALESYTSSLNNKTSSFATTGSNTFIGTQTISGSVLQSGSFTSTGTLTAQTLVVQTITSSVVYSSGSNIFGNTIGNTQTFTGSVLITGSLTISTGGNVSAPTIFGSTIACSPIGCFATSCATSFIGGTMSGTTIYGSTAVCSPVGKFSTCLDLGGALTGTSATFSSSVTANILNSTSAGSTQIFLKSTGGGSNRDWQFQTNETAAGDISLMQSTTAGGATYATKFNIASTGAATFTNTETTFNYNPQTNLLASYNYLNFGGGSIMYRNATDIYIGSNAKYGSAGTVVAGYTSLYGMGLLTMDAGTLNYQANNTSVTAGTAYGVPIRFTIKGDGNVGIGASSPCGKLQVVLPAYTNEDTDSQQAIFGSCTNGYGVRIGYNESCNAGYINSLKPGVAWSKLSLQGSSIVFAPTSTERVRVTTDGLTFNGDTAAANALDDYEEGDLTLGFAFNDACVGMTTSINCGKYTKIGRQVSITGAIVLTCKGSSTGDAIVYGLPYLIGNTNGHYSSAAFRNGDICFTGQFVGYGAINTSYIVLNQMSNAGVLSGINNNNFINASTMLISFTYFT